MSQIIEIDDKFRELQEKYNQYFPKVDPALINDLLLRKREDPTIIPIYMVEVFTKPNQDTQKIRKQIIQKTGMSPAIYDKGTHYVINQKLTLEILSEISEIEDVLEITGTYTGGIGGYGPSHDIRHFNQKVAAIQNSSGQQYQQQHQQHYSTVQDKKEIPFDRLPSATSTTKIDKKYLIAIFTALGIAASVAIGGFIISGGLLPNSNSRFAIPTTLEPGLLHGSVIGPSGLPAIGASVIAVDTESGFTANAFVSLNGQYSLDLPAGTYSVIVSYPDGSNERVPNFQVERGLTHELNFRY